MAELAELAELAKLVTPAQLQGNTRLLILQGTPFCNMACRYCYLPSRDMHAPMSMDTVSASVEWLYREGLASESLTIVWHAGEPLVLPPEWYEEAVRRAAAASPPGTRLTHCIQTNGVLIDDRWCDFFQRHQIRLGISIDGPAWLHDANRRRRSGDGSHAAVMRGVACLQRRGVPFHVICVITDQTLDFPDELVHFFLSHGIADLAFNIEEIEAANTKSSLSRIDSLSARYTNFIERVLQITEGTGSLSLREADSFLSQLLDPSFAEHAGNDQNTPFAIVAVTHSGGLWTFSPELAGITHDRLGPMVFGSVHHDRLTDILKTSFFRSIFAEISAGVDKCALNCAYFPLCHGGAPANKLAEHGRMDVTETLHCQLTQKVFAEVALRRIERRFRNKHVAKE